MLTDKSKEAQRLLVASLVLLSVLTVSVCLMIGRYSIGFSDLWAFLTGTLDSNDPVYNVLLHIRIPRILLSYLVGVALAVSGAAYQSLFQNRLVSPGVLGVNSGACVGAGLCILLGAGAVVRTAAAFSFGVAAAVIALIIQKLSKSRSPLVLVLAGITVSALMNSVIGIIKYVADGQNKLASITFWMLGSISNAEMEHIYLMLPTVLICSGVIMIMSWRLNAMSLGEKEALSIGINYRANRLIIICFSTLLTSVTVSISGSVDWVGLIIPNIARSITGSDNRKLIPVAVLTGGIFMTIVDTAARSISVNEIPLGIITGLFGAIAYAFILIGKRRV